jgi:hypothetical protein
MSKCIFPNANEVQYIMEIHVLDVYRERPEMGLVRTSEGLDFEGGARWERPYLLELYDVLAIAKD